MILRTAREIEQERLALKKSPIYDLINALKIFAKYMENDQYPTTCQHDFLYVCVDAELVSAEDEARLDALGFHPDENGGYCSSRFGSC